MPYPAYEHHWRDSAQALVGNPALSNPNPVGKSEAKLHILPARRPPNQASLKKLRQNKHVLPRCGTIMPPLPTEDELMRSPGVFQNIWNQGANSFSVPSITG